MPRIQVNGIQIYYEIHGQGDPLVLIMGLHQNSGWWYRQLPALSERFRVIIFDNRGAGRTDIPETDYSIRLFADDTAGLIQALGLGSVHVLGVSMGGFIAQELAINYPDLVRTLILGCTSCGGPRAVVMGPERMAQFLDAAGLTEEQIVRRNFDLFFSDGFVRDNPDKIEQFVQISLKYVQPAHAFVRQFTACGRHDTTDRLGAISAPTWIVAGDDDPLIPSENSRILQELMPEAALTLYPGLRHVFFIEDPDRFNNDVLAFIDRHSSRL